MSKYLISVVENYRVDTEQEAINMIQEAKDSNQYALPKYGSQYKERKQKGEIVDAYWKVSLTKVFDDEKEPCGNTSIEYKEGAF